MRTVIVGASLAGHTVAAELRERGYDGELVVIGDEPSAPYDRPPLSKGFLSGALPAEALQLQPSDLAVEWRLGQRAVGLDVTGRQVHLADGSSVTGDLVVLATGARARTLAEVLGPDAEELEGVHHLRSVTDAEGLRADLSRGGRLVVLGGGFIGCEVAATARGLGLDVTVVEAGPAALVGPLGAELAAAMAAAHARRGVELRCGVGVTGLRGDTRVEAVVLADGTELPCDTVLAALGSAPAVDWLRGSGLEVDGGVRCDERGVAAPGVVAVGDCAAWWDPALGRHHRVEHWTDAWERARAVAAYVVDPAADSRPASTPYFWSDQHDLRVQLAGRRHPDARFVVEDGSAETEDLLGVWWLDDEPVAVAGINRARDIGRWRRRLTSTPASTSVLTPS